MLGDDQFSGEAQRLAFSPDGKQFAAAAGHTVRLWETATGKELPLLGGHRSAPTMMTLSADGKTAVSWGADRVLRRWDASTGKSLGAFPAPPNTALAALSADGSSVALASADNLIRIHETTTGKELRQIKPGAGVSALAFTPDGKTLAVRGGDNNIRLFDVSKGAEVRQIALRAPVNTDGRQVVIVLGGYRRAARGSSPGLAFTPDGKLLAALAPANRGRGNAPTAVVFFDVATGKELRKVEPAQGLRSFAFSPDGRTLATENADRTISLWEVASGKERAHLGKASAERPQGNEGVGMMIVEIDGIEGFAGPSEPVGPVGLAFSPDGRALAARGADKSVHVWDINAGKEIAQLKGHTGRIETVAFAANGKTLASGAGDTTILLWDAAALEKDLSKPQPTGASPGGARGPLDRPGCRRRR